MTYTKAIFIVVKSVGIISVIEQISGVVIADFLLPFLHQDYFHILLYKILTLNIIKKRLKSLAPAEKYIFLLPFFRNRLTCHKN